MKLFNKYAESLLPVIEGKEPEIINLILKHLESKNRQLKDSASAILVNFCSQMSSFINDNSGKLYYQELLNFLLRRLKHMILQDADPNVLITCIQSYGSLGKAVKRIQGDKKLHECLHFLIENTESTLFTKLDRFENFDFEKNPQNFKAVLFNQKQLISYLRSLSFIIIETSNLENYEVNFILKIVKISIKYLTNFFPPYVKSLCESFSLFLNSLPVMNYNKIIFRLHITTIIESMQKHCDVWQMSHEMLFRDYYDTVVSDKLSLDKQAISLEQFSNIILDMVDKSENKSIDVYSRNKIAESVTEKQFFYAIMLFVDVLRKDHYIRLLEAQSKAALNLYCIVETKLLSNPKNFVMLRLLSCLLEVPEVLNHINYSEDTLASFRNLVDLIENCKNDYKDLMSVHQEFIVAAFKAVKRDFMVDFYKRFLMGIFASSIPSNILAIKIITSVTYFLQGPDRLSVQEKGQLLNGLLKLAEKYTSPVADNFEGGRNTKPGLLLYLNEGTVTSEEVFNNILSVVKLFSLDKYEEPEPEKQKTTLESSTALSQQYFLNDSDFKMHNEALFVYIANRFIKEGDIADSSNLFKLLHSLGKEINLRYKENMGRANAKDHGRFLKVVKKILSVLKLITETNQTNKEEIFELAFVFFVTLFADFQLAKPSIVKIMKYVKKLHINDYEQFNKNNRSFQEIFCLLLKTSILKTSEAHSQYLNEDNIDAINEIFDFIKLNIYNPYESIQIFNIQIFEVFFNFMTRDSDSLFFFDELYESFIAIIGTTGESQEVSSLQMRKTFEKLYETSLVISTRMTRRMDNEHMKFIELLTSCIRRVCSHKCDGLLFDKMKILVKLSSNDLVSEPVSAFLAQACEQMIDAVPRFRLKMLRLFITSDSYHKLAFAQEVIDGYKKNQSSKEFKSEIKTFCFLLLIFDEMKIIQHMLSNNDLAALLISFLFEGTVTLSNVNLKLLIERLSSYLTEREELKERILPLIINKEFKNDLFKNIDELSRNQFQSKLRSLFCLLKAFSTADIKTHMGQTFMNVMYSNLKDTWLTRHETSLEYNKAKTLFTFLVKLKLVDASFCYEIIKQEKTSDLIKVLHKNVNRFNQGELQSIFSQLLEAAFLDKSTNHFTRFLKQFHEINHMAALNIKVNIDSLVENEKLVKSSANEFLEFMILLANLKIHIEEHNIQQLQQVISSLIVNGADYNVFLLIQYLNAAQNDQLASAILSRHFDNIKVQLFKEIPINLSSLLNTAKEYQSFADFVHNVYALSAKMGTLDYLGLTYFLMPSEDSAFNKIFDSDSTLLVSHFANAIDWKKFILGFISSVVHTNSRDHGQIDYLLNVSNHIVEHFISGLNSNDVTAVLENILLCSGGVLDTALDQANGPEEFSDLLVKKIIMTSLMDVSLGKLSKSEIVDSAFKSVAEKLYWSSKNDTTGGAVTKRLCLLYSQTLSQISQYEQKIKSFALDQSETLHSATQTGLLKLLHTLAAKAYNFLVVLILKTQTKLNTILNFLLFNESSKEKESNLLSAFFDSIKYDFKVLTEFQAQSQAFTIIENQALGDQTHLEAYGTFESQDRQNDFQHTGHNIHTTDPANSMFRDARSLQFNQKASGFYGNDNTPAKNFASYMKTCAEEQKSLANPYVREPNTPMSHQSPCILNHSLFSVGVHNQRRLDELMNTNQCMQIENFEDNIESPPTIFELDDVNQHPCMVRFMMLIVTLIKRGEDSNIWIQKLIDMIALRPENLSMRLFILKAVSNQAKYFMRFKYLALAANGGKGLHYFYRDMCCLFIEWNKNDKTFAVKDEEKEAYFQAIKNLISKIGDEHESIFRSNLQLFRDILSIINNDIVIDMEIVFKMLRIEGHDKPSLIWKTAGLHILESLIYYNNGIFSNEPTSTGLPFQEEKVTAETHQRNQRLDSTFDLLVKPLYPAIVANQKNQKQSNQSLQEAILNDKLAKLKTLEKFLYSILGHTSKGFVKVLGRVIGKLCLLPPKIFHENELNNQLALNILDAYPRTNECFFILLERIVKHNNQFYLRNRCFRKQVLDRQNFSNDKYAYYIQKIALYSLTANNSDLLSEKLCLINDLCDLLPQIIRTSFYLSEEVTLDIIAAIIDFDFAAFANFVCPNLLAIWQKQKRQMSATLKASLKAVCENFITRAFQSGFDCINTATVFHVWSGTIESVESYNERINNALLFNNKSSLSSILKFLIADGSNIRAGIYSFTVFILNNLKKSDSDLDIECNTQEDVAKFKQMAQNQLQLPSNYLSQDLSEKNFSLSLESSLKKPYSQSANKESLKLMATRALNKNSSEHMDDSDADEGALQTAKVLPNTALTNNDPVFQRFNKQVIDKMPARLLKMYGKNKMITGNNADKATDATPKSRKTSINLLLSSIAESEANTYFTFATLMMELIKTASNKEKSAFISLAIQISAEVSRKKVEQSNLRVFFDILNDMLYQILKDVDLDYFLNPQSLDLLNDLEASHLSLLLNEEFFIKLNEQYAQSNTNKANIPVHLDRIVDFKLLSARNLAPSRVPLLKSDTFVSDSVPGIPGESAASIRAFNIAKQKNDFMDQGLLNKALSRTITNLFSFSHSAALNTFYKLYIPKEKDYDTLITSINNNLYREVAKIIESLESEDNAEFLNALIIKQKQECFAALEKWDQLVELTSSKNDQNIIIDENTGSLAIKSLSALPVEDQEFLMHAFIMDSRYWNAFKDNTSTLFNTKSEKEFLESHYANELAFLALTTMDYERTIYYNELHKDNIKHSISSFKSKSISGIVNRIKTYTKVDSFAKYITENHYIAEDEHFQFFISQFKVGRNEHDNSKEAQFDFSLNNLLLHLMLEKYRTNDCDSISKLLLKNQIAFANNLTKLHNIEASERRLKGLLSTNKEIFDDEVFTYKFIKAYTNLRQNSLPVLLDQSKIKSVLQFFGYCRPKITSPGLLYKFKLLEAMFGANCIKFAIDSKVLETHKQEVCEQISPKQFLMKTQEILKIDRLLSQGNALGIRGAPLPDIPANESKQHSGLWEEKSAFSIQDKQHDFPFSSNFDASKPNKLNENLSEISQQMLRLIIERKETNSPNFGKLLDVYFKNTCFLLHRSTNTGYKLPFMFKIIKEFPRQAIPLFKQYSDIIPPLMLIDWIPQLVQFMDSTYGYFSRPVLQELISLRPQLVARHLMFYAELPGLLEFIHLNKSKLEPYFDLFKELKLLNDPELSLLEQLNELKLLIETESQDKIVQSVKDFQNLLSIIQPRHPSSLPSKILIDFKVQFESSLEQLISLLIKISGGSISKEVTQIVEAMKLNVEKSMKQRYPSNSLTCRLQDYSEKLASFNLHYRGNFAIEYFMCPSLKSKTLSVHEKESLKIIDIKAHVTVMNSLRKPKKINFLCSDNKIRYLLFKSGEDLREDQRIMAMFKIFNNLLDKQQPRDHINSRLTYYDVLPIDRNHGLLEWIPNSFSLKSLIEKDMGLSDLHDNPAMHQRQSFLMPLGQDPVSRHLALYNLDSLKILQEYDKEVEYMQKTILRRAIMKRLSSAGEFFETRKSFFSSYGLNALAGYLLGIGDRHLDNFVFNDRLDLYQIDFGCSFNFGLHLTIPELVPFRLTPMILSFGLPFEIEGTFKSTYMAAANIFYLSHDMLNDYVEIYLSEPVENWQKLEKRYGLLMAQNQERGKDLSAGHQWLTKRRLDVFNRKLKGDCPKTIMVDELSSSLHRYKSHFENMVRVLEQTGTTTEVPECLSAVERINWSVREVINMAVDKNLLGRMWTGWMSFV